MKKHSRTRERRHEPTGYKMVPGGPNGAGDWTAWLITDGDYMYRPIATGKSRMKVERQATKIVRAKHRDWAWENSGGDEEIVHLFSSATIRIE